MTTLWALLALHYREPAGISREALARSKERGLKFLSDHPPADTLQSLALRIMLNQRLGKADGSLGPRGGRRRALDCRRN